VIEVELDDATTLDLIFKEGGVRNRLPGAPALARFIRSANREMSVYEELLAQTRLDTPRLYASVRTPSLGRYWLFLERAPGTELRWSLDPTSWRRAATWLASAHQALGATGSAPPSLLRHDAAYYRRWLGRARRFMGPADGRRRVQLAWIAAHYDTVIESLTSQPKTVIHGEFYPANIVVDDSQPNGRISVVDWEMAAVGPAVIDLAALIGGDHGPDDRDAMVDAYRAAMPRSGAAAHAISAEGLTCGRLHLAMQWLGWAGGWSPPDEQRHDWLSEAVELGETMGW
jgi:aminoglycoside phosphotransferase (APT) family kinase protein